jgi:transposase
MSESENRPVRSRAATHEVWAERMSRFEQSGVTVVAFCRAEGISHQAFYYWKHKFDPQAAADAGQPRLLPVRLLDAAPIELLLPNGCSLRLTPGCDLAFVRSLLSALGDAPC